jgi:hypothetical protein
MYQSLLTLLSEGVRLVRLQPETLDVQTALNDLTTQADGAAVGI